MRSKLYTLFTALFIFIQTHAQVQDMSFAGDGVLEVAPLQEYDQVFELQQQGSHMMCVVGNSLSDVSLKAYDLNGQPATSYGDNGAATGLSMPDTTWMSLGYNFELSNNRQFLFAQDATYWCRFGEMGAGEQAPHQLKMQVLKISTDGHPDSAFGINGLVEIPLDVPATGPLDDNEHFQGAQLTDTGIMMMGTCNDSLCLVHLNFDGTLNSNFGDNGVSKFQLSTSDKFGSYIEG